MLVVELNRANFEYDVNSIVRAFYPEEQVYVLTPECREEKWAQFGGSVRIRVELREDGALLSIVGNDYLWEWRGDAPEDFGFSGSAYVCADVGTVPEEAGDVAEEPDSAVVRPEDTVCAEEAAVHGKTIKETEEDEKEYKYGFKCFFYRTLCEETGKELPWGNLTGIRPTKIAYQLLEQGACEEDIIEHYMQRYYVSREKAELSVDIARRERELLSGLGSKGELPGEGSGYSIYIGIPFCPSTCLYCSFTSFPIAAYRKDVDRYIDCLIREMEHVAELYRDRRLDCVYIGGGTPTTLEAEQLERLLVRLKGLFDFSSVREFTVEAGRADSITGDKLRVLYRYGVDRISVNPQTMKQETLDVIGRKASVEQVEEAYALARRAGFDNINMDLILGLPGELEADVQRTIDRVVELAPDSLTVHSLAIKRASRLNRWIQENGMPVLHNTDETMGIAAKGAERLGLVPYYLYRQKNMSGNFENVGYAREGKFGLYNILIMEEKQTIVACGAGSISKRVYPDGLIKRSENVKDVSQYIERIGEMIERKRVLLED